MYGKYHSIKKQLSWDSGVTWYDADPLEILPSGSSVGVFESLSDCESDAIYRWVVVSNSFQCVGNTKMTQEKKQKSLDSGATWSDVTPIETRAVLPVIEYDSQDCGTIGDTEYRWVDTGESGCTGCDCDNMKFMNNDEPSWATKMPDNNEIHCESAVTASKKIYAWLSTGGTTSGIYKPCFNDNVKEIYSCKPDGTTGSSIFGILERGTFTDAVLPQGLTKFEGGFQYSTNLEYAVIPSGVTSLEQYFFHHCSSLKTVIILSENLTFINYEAFNYCTKLETLILFSKTVPSLGSNVFAHTPGNLKIFVPRSSLSAYKSAGGYWGLVKDKIYPITLIQ